jgi:hypothetical protein
LAWIRFTKDTDIWGIVFKRGKMWRFPKWVADCVIPCWDYVKVIKEEKANGVDN